MSTYSLGSIASTSGCGEFRVLEIKPGKSRPPPLSSPQALNKEIRLGEVISITIDLEVLITIGGYTKVTLREVPQFLVNAFNIISRQGKYTEGIFRKEGNSGRINSINTYALFMGRQKIPPEFSVHDVCTLVKRFLRELKRPLIDSPAVCRNLFALAQKKTPISQAEFSSAFEVLQQSDKDKRKKLEPMSLPHVGTLGFIMRHLYNLSLHSVNHQMTPENFATVLACVIFNDDVAREKRRRENRRGSQEDLLAMKKEELSQKIAVLRMLIGNANWIGVPSNPYVTSQAGNGANGTSAGGQQHIDSSIAEKKLSSLELTKCRSSSCIPRLRMPLTETSNNCPNYGEFSPPQTKYPLIDTSVFKEPKSAEPDVVIPPEPLTPVAQKPPKTNETTPYSTPGSAIVGETRIVYTQLSTECSTPPASSTAASSPVRVPSPPPPAVESSPSPPPPVLPAAPLLSSAFASSTVSLPTPFGSTSASPPSSSFATVTTTVVSYDSQHFVESRPHRRISPPSTVSSSVSQLPPRVPSPVLMPPPPSFASNGVVFRKPALPSSYFSSPSVSASLSQFAKPSLPAPGSARHHQSRAARQHGPHGPHTDIDKEFINSSANVDSLKKGHFIPADPYFSRPSLAMVSTLGLVQNGVKVFSERQEKVSRQVRQERPSLPPSAIPRFVSSTPGTPNGFKQPRLPVKRDENHN